MHCGTRFLPDRSAKFAPAPTLLAELDALFFFRPEPYVHRVIFLTTAHRGGKLAANSAVRLGIELIRRNNPLDPAWTLLEAIHGRAVFQPFVQHRTLSSVDGLEAGNPLLMAIDAQAIAPDVVYHSIIANIRHTSSPEKMSDGLVSYPSAHLDGAASEHIVCASHSCESDPAVIGEVRRILYINLTER